MIVLISDLNPDAKSQASKFFSECTQYFSTNLKNEILTEMRDQLIQERKLAPNERPDKKKDQELLATKREVGHALKGVVRTLDAKACADNLPTIITKFLEVVDRNDIKNGQKKDVDIELICLDVIRDAMNSVGSTLSKELLGRCQSLTESLLDHKNENIRRACAATLGPVVVYLPEGKFEELIDRLLDAKNNCTHRISYVTAVITICESSKNRISSKVLSILRFLLTILDSSGTDPSDANHALWEEALKGITTLIQVCPMGFGQDEIQKIVSVGEWGMSYDPFFEGGAGLSENVDTSAWDAELQICGSTASDQRDTTWKIRRVAVNLFTSLIRARGSELKPYFGTICSSSIQRFDEREALVRVDVFKLAGLCVSQSHSETVSTSMAMEPPLLVRQTSLFLPVDAMLCAAHKTFDNSDMSSKAGIIELYQNIYTDSMSNSTFNDYLTSSLDYIMPHVKSAVSSQNLELRQAGLECIALLFSPRGVPYDYLSAHIFEVLTVVASCLTVSALVRTALETMTVLICALQYVINEENGLWIADAVLPVFAQKDVSEAVRLAAVKAASSLFANFGDNVIARFDAKVVAIFVERLSTSPLCCLQGLTSIARAESKLDMKALVACPQLTTLVAKTSVPMLPQTTLECMTALIKRHPDGLSNDKLVIWVDAVLASIDANQGLVVRQAAFDTLAVLLPCRNAGPIFSTKVIPKLIDLSQDAYLSGGALASLAKVFAGCVRSKARDSNMGLNGLLNSLVGKYEAEEKAGRRPNVKAASVCIAFTVHAGDVRDSKTATERFIADISHQNASKANLGLYTVGELATLNDFSSIEGLQQTILAQFDSKDFETRTAAALVLGSVYRRQIPTLLRLVEQKQDIKNAGKVNLFLSALQSCIAAGLSEPETMKPHSQAVFAALNVPAFLDNKTDGVPELLASCIGRLCVIDSDLLYNLADLVEAKQPMNHRILACNAFRNSFSTATDYKVVETTFESFKYILESKTADGMALKLSFVSTISALILANKGFFSRQLVNSILPGLYYDCLGYADRFEEEDWNGMFKILKDHGAALRRGVMTCLNQIYDSFPRFLDMKEFVFNVKNGLIGTKYEIKDGKANNDKISLDTETYVSTLALLTNIGRTKPEAFVEHCLNVSSNIFDKDTLMAEKKVALAQLSKEATQIQVTNHRNSNDRLKAYVTFLYTMRRDVPGASTSKLTEVIRVIEQTFPSITQTVREELRIA